MLWIKSDYYIGVSGGWVVFSCDYCLEEGDVCVFEVIDFEDWIIFVYIFRVVDVDFVFGFCGGWDKNYRII